MTARFAHLHVHSNYSLREGAARVEDLAQTAAAMGMDALALTDHDGMYGAVRFTLACKDAGVRPILGAELEWGEGYHVTLLAQNALGWSNLCRLVTEMHLDQRSQSLTPGVRPRTNFESLAKYSEGLFALSGCERGEIPWLLSLGQRDLALAAARRWLDVFGPKRFAIEVTNHLLETDVRRTARLTELARSSQLRTVATNNVHYVSPKDAVIHDVLECIRRIVPLDFGGFAASDAPRSYPLVAATPPSPPVTRHTVPRQNAEYWLKSSEQMAVLHTPEAIEGARWAADQCGYEFTLGEFHFPDPAAEAGLSSTGALARRCFEGLTRRYPKVTRAIEDRLQSELLMIRKSGFCGYFVLVADIVDHAKKVMGIRCACRGSAAGSLVAYALGISDVDPVRYDLVFERFMNEHRREIPDIDIDFESARREEVNDYILTTYGDRTAMVAMMETFKARAALREVGKALGINPTEIDTVAKAFPRISAGSIPEALESLPEVAGMHLGASRLEMLFDLAARLDSYPRHLAMHPSGVILSDSKLGDLMPMQRSLQGFLMSQFDKDDVETLGIAKLDVLGVRMFSSFAHTLNEIERTHGHRLSIDEIPRDDPETFELIRDSRTLGCFQIESPGQRELLGKFQPERFEDLIVDISLFRPGPMKADMIRPFLNRRMGLEYPEYPHPSLVPILKETKGVIVYHEQVMRVISALTGCSLGEADKIRRSLGGGLGDEDVMRPGDAEVGGFGGVAAAKGYDLRAPEAANPPKSTVDEVGMQIVAQALERGFERDVATKIWREIASFASFGFCKAHAAAFAVPTYQSAWLKTHYPAEFYCGVLTHDPGMYPRRAILADARAHGIEILPVDVNASWPEYRAAPSRGRDSHFLPDPEATAANPPKSTGIRLGLQDVRGISGAEIDSIIQGRPWKSFRDFCRRAEVSRPVAEALVHCGAFDGVKGKASRRELFWEVEQNWSDRQRQKAEQASLDLFEAVQVRLPGIADYTARERVSAELEVTGLDASLHLISFYASRLESLGWTKASELRRFPGGATVVVAGVKVATQTPPTKSGKRVVFLTLEDGTGQSDITFFDEAQRKYARVVFDGWILAVRGTLRRTGAKGVSILAEEVIDLAAESRGKLGGTGDRKLWYSSSGSAGR